MFNFRKQTRTIEVSMENTTVSLSRFINGINTVKEIRYFRIMNNCPGSEALVVKMELTECGFNKMVEHFTGSSFKIVRCEEVSIYKFAER